MTGVDLPANYAAVMWGRVIPVPLTAAGAAVSLDKQGVAVFGWAIEEPTGEAPARVVLVDGSDASGILAVPLTFTPGQSRCDLANGWALRFPRGIAAVVTLGSVQGSVFVADLPPGKW